MRAPSSSPAPATRRPAEPIRPLPAQRLSPTLLALRIHRRRRRVRLTGDPDRTS